MSTKDARRTCLIVGAGMAGLTAAKWLQRENVRVTVIDKGRGVGGRMATRRFGGGIFDHGAQFVTARDAQFREAMRTWEAEGVAVKWSDGFSVAGKDTRERQNGHPRYRGEPGMTALPKALASDADVLLATRIESIRMTADHWHAMTEDGQEFVAEALILTPPVPQSLALVDAGNAFLPETMDTQLRAIEYHPCLALLVLFDSPTNIPAPGALQFDNGPIRWMADNQQKGVSPGAVAVTIHAAPDFSRRHWDTDVDQVAEKLLAAAAEWLPSGARAWQLHRWRYSQPVLTDPTQTEAYEAFSPGPPPLAFAGDAFSGGRVEGAALSGRRAAQQIAKVLTLA